MRRPLAVAAATYRVEPHRRGRWFGSRPPWWLAPAFQRPVWEQTPVCEPRL